MHDQRGRAASQYYPSLVVLCIPARDFHRVDVDPSRGLELEYFHSYS